MREDGVELEIRTPQHLGQCAAQVVEPEPEPVHPRVDLEVTAQPLLVPRRGRLHSPRGPRRRDRRREPTVEQPIEVTDAERPEYQDLSPNTRRPQRGTFLNIRTRQQIRPRILERPPNLRRPVTVSIRLHDRDDPRRPRGLLAPKMIDDRAIVRLERLKIDARNRRPNPFSHYTHAIPVTHGTASEASGRPGVCAPRGTGTRSQQAAT